MTKKEYDVITYGRSSIDLYSANIGAPFVDIKAFNAYVGGSPLNIAVGTKRLGLKSAPADRYRTGPGRRFPA
jgi:5-dehydro-2-deoxygluconokinase